MAALSIAVPLASDAAPARHTIGSSPAWASPARQVGTTKAGSQVYFGVVLNMRNRAGATALIRKVSTPGSADYGRYLSSAQFRSRFAPTTATVAAVQKWLRSQGFTIRTTFKSGLYIGAQGTARQVEQAFGTSLKQYRYHGQVVRANSTALSLPASAPTAVVHGVSGIIGVDQGSELMTPAKAEPGPPVGSRYGVTTQPCSKYYRQKIATTLPEADGAHQPYATCGNTPKQLEGAYGVSKLINSGNDGSGVTVAITDAYASPTIVQDTAKYNQMYGLPAFKDGQFSQITPGPKAYKYVGLCGASGWYGEETLDVEAVHSMAPGANIVYVGGTDCVSGLNEAWAKTIDNHTADIVTNSWGEGTDDINLLGQDFVDYYETFSYEAALTGITVNFSTADDGDYTSGGTNPSAKTVSFPSDLPYVTGVGGTSVFLNKKSKWVAEYGWQNAYSSLSPDGTGWTTPKYSSGGGGGTSQLFAQPWYQQGVVPDSVSQYYGSTPMRAIPDVSMDGDPNTGFVVGQTQVFPDGTYWDRYRIGGTSLSSPLMAGVDALISQKAGQPLGFANPLYYALNETSAVHDIVAPSSPVAQVRTDYANFLDASDGMLYRLVTVDVPTTLHSTPGWDDETGVGTPNGTKFVSGMADLTRGS